MERITHQLAHHIVNFRFENIPNVVRHEAVRSLINWTGVTVGGARHETVNIAMAALAEFSGPAQATILGRGERLDILHAALMNGMASAVLDFDATQFKLTNIHPSGPVLPAILALSERTPTSGSDFITAFILGVEVECRLANVIFGSKNPGWHVTGAVGAIGAAAAAGRLLGLNEDQMVRAFGIAATQPGGLRDMYGTMCKSFTPGRASQNGLGAALLAAKGFGSSDQCIEAPMGFAKILADVSDLAGLTQGLGNSFEIMTNIYKPFACAIVLHPIIDGCLQLKEKYQISPDQVERVTLTVNPNLIKLAGKENPKTGLEAKFSFGHVVALALVKGAAGQPQFSDALINDDEIKNVRGRVSARIKEDIAKDEAHVEILLRDGQTISLHVQHALGSLENPMSDQDLEEKFRSLVEDPLGKKNTDHLLSLCWAAESLADTGDIARATSFEY